MATLPHHSICLEQPLRIHERGPATDHRELRLNGRIGPRPVIAYKITNGPVAQFVTLASAASDRP
jgi:hypothetical protein